MHTKYKHAKTGQVATKSEWIDAYQEALDNPDGIAIKMSINGRSAEQCFDDYVKKGWIYEVKE